MLANTTKKEWLTPELELCEVDQTKGGSSPAQAENFGTLSS